MQLSVALVLLILTAYILRKLTHVHLLLYDVRDQSRSGAASLFRQIEALQGLYAELDLKGSLPPTRGWAASPDFLLELARHARQSRPALVVECSSGISTLVLARCMQLNGSGKVISLEHDAHFSAQTRSELHRLGLQDCAQVVDAPLQAHELDSQSWPWYDISRLPADMSIDMLIIDGPPQSTRALARYPAGPLLFPRLSKQAYVFMDDAARKDEQEILKRWQHQFPALDQSLRTCEKGCAVLRATSVSNG